ncbi:hypothetical protein [Paenibacillus sp. KS-LC4]|uniref:hypothetical protein n=1 Tax=Paenibacillus sp. KS-LC4 TaxID=2979727 RepID=UPI0030CBADBB
MREEPIFPEGRGLSITKQQLPRSSLLSIGGMLLPLVIHGIHLLLPLLLTGSIAMESSMHRHHDEAASSGADWVGLLLSGITAISVIVTIIYLYRIWTSKTCSKTNAWLYTGISVACFALIAATL